MSIICWTVFFPGSPSVSHRVTHLAHAAGRRVRPIVRHTTLPHHAAKIATQPHGWFKLVCKVIPAALAGGGALLAPHPATPPQLAATPPAFIAPGPVVPPQWQPATVVRRWPTPPPLVSGPPVTIASGHVVPRRWRPAIVERHWPTPVPEPSSAALLLGGVSGLLLLRLSKQRLAYSSDQSNQLRARRSCSGAVQSCDPR